NRRDVQLMQQRLEKKGYDVGGADGLVGFKTRVAVGRWQVKKGFSPTCFPDAGLIRSIR
ncbi:MAG TPA: peptidoglycan-binding domain-containing protein, partial [Afifellaceae bacterium]|nr:peptidoglycan-binding domain-containing protein [Afifellaceae bacterium]